MTNLASRLCGEARPGQVLAAKRVVAAVEDLVEGEAGGRPRPEGLLPARARPSRSSGCGARSAWPVRRARAGPLQSSTAWGRVGVSRVITRIHHVAVVVRDLEAALGFWRDTLELPLLHSAELPDQGRAGGAPGLRHRGGGGAGADDAGHGSRPLPREPRRGAPPRLLRVGRRRAGGPALHRHRGRHDRREAAGGAGRQGRLRPPARLREAPRGAGDAVGRRRPCPRRRSRWRRSTARSRTWARRRSASRTCSGCARASRRRTGRSSSWRWRGSRSSWPARRRLPEAGAHRAPAPAGRPAGAGPTARGARRPVQENAVGLVVAPGPGQGAPLIVEPVAD